MAGCLCGPWRSWRRAGRPLLGAAPVIFALVGLGLKASATTIDFQTPSLGTAERKIINPLVANGVTFTALPGPEYPDAVVGLVRNSATSACVGARDSTQKLGTGRVAFREGGIGGSGFPIKATFAVQAGSVRQVSVEFQALAGVRLELTLYGDSGEVVGFASELAAPADSGCGMPGQPRARKRLTAPALEPVRYAIMRVVPQPWASVYVISDFAYGQRAERTKLPGSGRSPPDSAEASRGSRILPAPAPEGPAVPASP